jgi:hypothetical protein
MSDKNAILGQPGERQQTGRDDVSTFANTRQDRACCSLAIDLTGQLDRNIDIATRRLRIRASLVCFVEQRLGDGPR